MKWAAAATAMALGLGVVVYVLMGSLHAGAMAEGAALVAAGAVLTLAGLLGAPHRRTSSKPVGTPVASESPQRATA